MSKMKMRLVGVHWGTGVRPLASERQAVECAAADALEDINAEGMTTEEAEIAVFNHLKSNYTRYFSGWDKETADRVLADAYITIHADEDRLLEFGPDGKRWLNDQGEPTKAGEREIRRRAIVDRGASPGVAETLAGWKVRTEHNGNVVQVDGDVRRMLTRAECEYLGMKPGRGNV